jgi:hypothetical protein
MVFVDHEYGLQNTGIDGLHLVALNIMIENCGCGPNNGKIDDPKGFAEIAEYAYDNYGDTGQEDEHILPRP